MQAFLIVSWKYMGKIKLQKLRFKNLTYGWELNLNKTIWKWLEIQNLDKIQTSRNRYVSARTSRNRFGWIRTSRNLAIKTSRNQFKLQETDNTVRIRADDMMTNENNRKKYKGMKEKKKGWIWWPRNINCFTLITRQWYNKYVATVGLT